MYVPMLAVPGMRVHHLAKDGKDLSRDVESLLHGTQSGLADACLALSMFVQARHAMSARARMRARGAVMKARFTGKAVVPDPLEALGPSVPHDILFREPFLHARSFLASIDMIAKYIDAIAKLDGSPTAVRRAHSGMKSSLPDLVHVRDSVQHEEERRQRKAKKKQIAGHLMVDCIDGDNYQATMADGHLGTVRVHQDTIEIARRAVQATMSAFKWDVGSPWPAETRHWPR